MHSEQTKLELFKNLHDLQYQRINKIENQNNYVTSFVTGLSTITVAYAFKENTTVLTIFNGVIFPLLFISANVMGILYLYKSRKFIKLHQNRATAMRKTFAPEFQKVYDAVGKKSYNGFFSNRIGYMIILHALVCIVGIGIILAFFLRIPLQ